MRAALSFLVAASLAGCATAAPVGVVWAPEPERLRATPRTATTMCGTDGFERHAMSLADLDHDGSLDRVSIVRAGATVTVRLHDVPGLRSRRAWTLPAGHVEIATPRRRGSTEGDLWLSVGRGADKPWSGSTAPESQAWTETLYHLDGGELVGVISGYRDIDIRVDVDGDGRVDPIGGGGGQRVLLGDTWVALPVVLSSYVHGVPLAGAPGQEEAVDLDGNGVRELALELEDGVSLVEVPSLRTVWKAAGKPSDAALLRWGPSIVLAVRLDGRLRVFATDASHAEIASYPEAESFADIHGWVDPVSGAARLMITGYPTQLYDRADPTTPIASFYEVAPQLDGRLPRFGATRLGRGEAAGAVVIEHDPEVRRSAWPESGTRVRLLDPATAAARRVVWRSGPMPFDSDADVELIDLDGDGASRLLVRERTSAEDVDQAVDTLRLRVLGGRGHTLWEEADPRTNEWRREVKPPTEGEGDGDGDAGEMKLVKLDQTWVRAIDLGDGTLPLRVRSDVDEYYVLSPRSKLTTIPPCLE